MGQIINTPNNSIRKILLVSLFSVYMRGDTKITCPKPLIVNDGVSVNLQPDPESQALTC